MLKSLLNHPKFLGAICALVAIVLFIIGVACFESGTQVSSVPTKLGGIILMLLSAVCAVFASLFVRID